MSDEKKDKPPANAKHEGVRIAMLRFVGVQDLPGDQVSHVVCGPEPKPANKSYTCSFHPAMGMYELRCYLNGTLAKELWIPRERAQSHEVLK